MITLQLLSENPIIEWDTAKLKKKSRIVQSLDEGMKIAELLISVAETFYKDKSAGLAAPQIGIFKRVFICHSVAKDGMPAPPYQISNEWQAFINPVIHETEGEGLIDYDGCLSFPGLVAITKRNKRIKISAMNAPEPVWLEPGPDETREDGFATIGIGDSIIFQHEFDHLNGVMFFERAEDEEEMEELKSEVRKNFAEKGKMLVETNVSESEEPGVE